MFTVKSPLQFLAISGGNMKRRAYSWKSNGAIWQKKYQLNATGILARLWIPQMANNCKVAKNCIVSPHWT
jgi:hypothetical protein